MKIKPGSFLLGVGLCAAAIGLFTHAEPAALSIVPIALGIVIICVGGDEMI